ncbi:4-hydroxy-3-methylbut-2-en-1-yl diphosphate synthase (ferredoxin), chloroplastic [Nicotiana attenuata]|uniref:4-hydroxy-3-methylbut-2-en-1-yl diphosphate synthase (Ferredoxin), chloroplastic n=1 Tax=Nicotiana attenuata TaxID=49451 RepID=A0A1J6JST8_NICAT|nr:4-hydroxy-3-methylbut-2-en-1-yl diphosphate synthase (ferredoxin), chloroplastic [Nicotiana attenuata]
MKIADAGADIVRITVQGKKEADACFEIENSLVQKNCGVFEKIRVNPGNFADRRAQFEQLEYTEEDYQKELEHIEEVFTPLVEKYKKYERAIRIGTNHGSLSDRIMSYYGDSPRGMDGLGDTIRVSLTEPPEEEIDPCRRLANLGKRAAELQQGEALFEEKNRRYFDFQRRSGELPAQKEGDEVDYRGVLHRDGSVLMSVSLDQLKTPELLYRSLAAKLVVGMPFKDLATVDSILLRELPPVEDKDSVRTLVLLCSIPFVYGNFENDLIVSLQNEQRLALKRLVDISMGVITPLSEQLTKPLPNAIVLVTLKELSGCAQKLLPESTRLVVSVLGDESKDELEILKSTDVTMILHNLPYTEEKIGRVHAARRLFEYLSENSLNFPNLKVEAIGP